MTIWVLSNYEVGEEGFFKTFPLPHFYFSLPRQEFLLAHAENDPCLCSCFACLDGK